MEFEIAPLAMSQIQRFWLQMLRLKMLVLAVSNPVQISTSSTICRHSGFHRLRQGCTQCVQGCDQINQVSIDQPVYPRPESIASGPTSILTVAIVNTDPLPANQIYSGYQVTTCQTTSGVACNSCQLSRTRLLRGRVF